MGRSTENWPEKATQREEWKAMGEAFAQLWDGIQRNDNIFSIMQGLHKVRLNVARFYSTILSLKCQ